MAESLEKARLWSHRGALVPLLAVGLAGLGVFFIAIYLALREVPDIGDARLEATIQALTALGATLVAFAVTVGSVIVALGLEERRRSERVWREAQLELVRQADDWIRSALSVFGAIIALQEEAAHSTDERDASLKREEARDVAQEFYGRQRLADVSRWCDLIDNVDVRKAVAEADGTIRLWNETVAGDHTTRKVSLEGADVFRFYGVLGDAADVIERGYIAQARALHSA